MISRGGQVTRIRPYMLNRLKVCPSSFAESLGKVDAGGPAAALGRAYHALMAWSAKCGRVYTRENLAAGVARQHAVDREELLDLFDRLTFDPSTYEDPEAEVWVDITLGEEETGGIIDLAIDHGEGQHEIIDYKTTRLVAEEEEPSVHAQLLSYAVGLWQRLGSPGVGSGVLIRAALAFPRSGDEFGWTHVDLNPQQLADAREWLTGVCRKAREQVDLPPERRSYRVDEVCRQCAGALTCPAFRAQSALALSMAEEGQIAIYLTRENAHRAWTLQRMMTSAADALKEGVRALIAEGGPILSEDGKKILETRDTKGRKESLHAGHVARALHELGLDHFRPHVLRLIDDRTRVPSRRTSIYNAPKELPEQT